MPFKARIVILNYNGKEMLDECVASIAEAAQRSLTPTAVTVLDNGSTDGSEDFIRSNFPGIEFVKAPQNLVLCSYNAYLAKIKEPIAILLNNDIKVEKNFIDPLIQKFKEEPATFLVAPRVMSFDGSLIEAVDTRSGIERGMFWANARYPGYEAHAMVPSNTFSSGFGAFSREKFLALGGYDQRYFPGIMEDADLCLNASRKGFHLYYEPLSVVYHMGQVSFKKKFSNIEREALAHRNTFLFMWKNFNGIKFWISHILWLPIRMTWMMLKGKGGFMVGFVQAIRLIFLKRLGGKAGVCTPASNRKKS